MPGGMSEKEYYATLGTFAVIGMTTAMLFAFGPKVLSLVLGGITATIAGVGVVIYVVFLVWVWVIRNYIYKKE